MKNEMNINLKKDVLIQEYKLRKFIREIIKIKKDRKQKIQENQEKQLRGFIQNILKENKSNILKEDREDRPHHSTGINVLADDLRKIVPVLEIDYKKITTNEKQRKSFRAHIINAAKNVMSAENLEDDADVGVSIDGNGGTNKSQSDGSRQMGEGGIQEVDLDGDLEGLDIGNDSGQPPQTPQDPEQHKFINVDRPSQKRKEKEQKPEDTFTIPGEDTTGRNMAMASFKKIEKTIAESYGSLSDEEDKRLYYDYILANLRLWFSRFDEELTTDIQEPNTEIPNEQPQQPQQSPQPGEMGLE